MTRVAVLGARGRMGWTSVEALDAADGIEVVAQVDVGDSIDLVGEPGAEAALVFTTPDVALDQVLWCIERGVHVVVGTSGFDGERTIRCGSWMVGSSRRSGGMYLAAIPAPGVHDAPPSVVRQAPPHEMPTARRSRERGSPTIEWMAGWS